MKYGKDGGLGWQVLAESNGNPGANHGFGLEAGAGPVWLRIKKIGNTYTGFISTDGVTYQQAGDPLTVDGLDTTHIGLAAFNDGGTDNPVEFTVEYLNITDLSTYNFTAMTTEQLLADWSVDQEDSANWRLESGRGLVISSQRDGIYSGSNSCKNVFMLPASDSYMAEVKVTMNRIPDENWQQFALLAITDQDNYVKMKYGKDGDLGWQLLVESGGNIGENRGAPWSTGTNTVWLRIVKTGNTYMGYYSDDGITYHSSGEPFVVDGLNTTHIGLAAFNDGGTDAPIEFAVEYVKISNP